MKRIHFLLAAPIMLGAATASSQPPAQTMASTQRVDKHEISVRCDTSPTGECGYQLYAPECKEGETRNGRPSIVCTYTFVTGFTLKVGESRVLKGMPPQLKNCQVPFGKSELNCSV